MKKLFIALLSLCVLISTCFMLACDNAGGTSSTNPSTETPSIVIPSTSIPSTEWTSGDCFTVSDGIITGVTLSGEENTKIVVPSTINGVSITGIGDNAFGDCALLESITIPNGIISIGEYVFYGCPNLATITVESGNPIYQSIGNCLVEKATKTLVYGCKTSVIPNDGNVKTIGKLAFYNCKSLTSISIGNNITKIDNWAFYQCSSLESVTLSDNITSIGSSAFRDCVKLSSITIPKSVNDIGNYAFSGCKALSQVKFSAVNCLDLSGNNNVFYNSGIDTEGISVTIDSGVTNIPANLFYEVEEVTSVTFDSNNNCEEIGSSAFAGCVKIQSISIPDSVKNIGASAFDGCALVENITIGNSVESIGDSAFKNCIAITNVTIPDSVNAIGESAFEGCSLVDTLTIGNSVESIGASAFKNCISMISVTIPDSVKNIGVSAFESCSLVENVTIGNTITNITSSAFKNCIALTNVTIPDSVNTIGESAFESCSLVENVTMGNNVENIGASAFKNCIAITNVTIPDSVKNIGASAFEGCTKLNKITIGSSVETIGFSAFRGCVVLSDINFNATKMNDLSSYSNIFEEAGTNVSVNARIGANVTKIPAYLFNNFATTEIVKENDENVEKAIGGLKTIYFEEGSVCKSIEASAFSGCKGLQTFTIPNTVTTIGPSAFATCSIELENITIPENVESIAANTFKGCEKLKTIIIPNAITSIDATAFEDCKVLDAIIEEEGFLYLGNEENEYLALVKVAKESKEFGINQNTKIICDSAFASCDKLVTVSIPDTITHIGVSAFSGCVKLGNVTIPQNVKTIGASAFKNCEELTVINFNATEMDDLMETSNVFENAATKEKEQLKIKVNIGANVTKIPDYLLFNVARVSIITFEKNSVCASIGGSAFVGCAMLESITIDDGNQTYATQDGILYNKEKTEFIYIPKSIKGSITIPNSITATLDGDNVTLIINSSTFEGYDKLEAIVVDESHEYYSSQDGILYNKDKTEFIHIPKLLKGTVVIPDTITSIDNSAFSGCKQVEKIIIHSDIKSIGVGAFDGCDSLVYNKYDNALYLGNADNQYLVLVKIIDKEVTTCKIQVNTKFIFTKAFEGNEKLESIYYEGTSEQWAEISLVGSELPSQATVYYFSETEPSLNDQGTAYDGNYWHYVEEVPTIWVKEN